MNEDLVRDVIGVLVFLPAVAVWLMAMFDVLGRKDIRRRRRIVTAVVIAVLFPLALVYLLGRPPSSVRRGPSTAGDPRTPLLSRIESGRPGTAAVASPDDRAGRSDAELTQWIEVSLAGNAPRTR